MRLDRHRWPKHLGAAPKQRCAAFQSWDPKTQPDATNVLKRAAQAIAQKQFVPFSNPMTSVGKRPLTRWQNNHAQPRKPLKMGRLNG